MKFNKPILLLIDSFALIHRAYHAYPPSLITSRGEQVNAAYGYASLLIEVLQKFKPEKVVAVFDAGGPTFRHETYAAYKANRGKPDDEMIAQLPIIEETLKAFDIPILKAKGFEADDIIATLDKRHTSSDGITIIVTGDRDLFQLVDEDTKVYMAGGSFSQSKLYGPEEVKERMGIPPELIIDLKGLHGDASDNIPGVAGIGEKGAVDLINQFGNIDEIYKHIDEAPNRYKSKLLESYEIAKLSKELATVDRDVPISFDLESARMSTINAEEAMGVITKYEFKTLNMRLKDLLKVYQPALAIDEVENLLGIGEVAEDSNDWAGQSLGDKILIDVKLIGEEQLDYKFESVKAYSPSGIFNVKTEDVPSFFEVNKSSTFYIFGAHNLLHAWLNIDLKLKFYDLRLLGSVLCAGRANKDLDALFQYLEITDTSDKSKALEAVLQKVAAPENAQFQKVIEMEQKLLPIVIDMERRGVDMDVELLKTYSVQIKEDLANLQKQIFDSVGHEFNISSPAQLSKVLFEEKNLPHGKKTKTGGYSTDERTLRDLIGVEPTIELILKFRELTKLLGTYVEALPEYLYEKTGKVHTAYDQVGAVTGRFSSKDPNLQNIPIEEEGRYSIRKAFTSGKDAYFIAFDYSQQELRILAELAKEENLISAFQQGLDIHAYTASQLLGKDMKDITSAERRIGKTLNFGIVYGMSGFGLADRLKVDNKEAHNFIEEYFKRYPRIKIYFEELVKNAKESGYVATFLGRRREALGLRAGNFQVRSYTEREVTNFPLQGGAADVIKLAMIEVEKLVKDTEASLVLQIHDELVLRYTGSDIDSDNVRKLVQRVADCMQKVVTFDVPMLVEAKVGKNLADLKEYKYE